MKSISVQIKKISNITAVKLFWFAGLIIIAIIPAVLAVMYAPIDPDSAYYLSIMERMNEGKLLYVDLYLYYAPLVFYITLILKNVFFVGINYEFYLTIHFILQFLCAFFIYKIAVLVIGRKDFAFYACILYIISSHWNDGNAFLLETPSLLFGLISIYYTLKNPKWTYLFFGIGLLTSFSFLCKQYGLGFLGLIVYLILFNERPLKKLLLLLLGFSFPIILCFIIWGKSFFLIVEGKYGIDRDFFDGLYALLDRSVYFFIRIFPILIVSLFYLPILIKTYTKDKFKNSSFLWFGILGFMLQFYKASFSHYYLYIIPFAAILSFNLLNEIYKFKWIYLTFLIFTIILSIYSTYHNRVYKIYYRHPEFKEEQYTLATEILKHVDKTQTLYIADIGLFSECYLTNMVPPNLRKIGYTFGVGLSDENHLTQIKSAYYVLKFRKEYNDFDLNTNDVKNELQKKRQIRVDKNVILYER
jgi:hypothetical protein